MTVGRAVPWSRRAKNREKSCERCYFTGVFTSNPQGDRAKSLGGHENGEAWKCGASLFFIKNAFLT